MLYLHGWNDYFFQTHLADYLTELGLDFYALDLRRYGRSLRRGQLRGFITDLDDYGERARRGGGPDRDRPADPDGPFDRRAGRRAVGGASTRTGSPG